jgi:hypothetical protein
MNKKLKFILLDKKNYKAILHSFLFIVFISSVIFFIPKFFNYEPKLIQESFKKNSDINIKHISNIDYKFFPSPRLRLSGIDLDFGENILEVKNTEVDIILNPLRIFNYKIFDYNKFIIKGGSTNIKTNKVDQLFDYIKKNKIKINFIKNNIVLERENKKLFEIKNSVVKFNTKDNIQQLSVTGLFLNHKVFFILKDKNDSKINIELKVPDLDILANILLENIDNSKTFSGLINFEVLNNFFQFNLIKEKNISITQGFIRSSLVNSSFEGDVSFKPFFSFNLNVQPSSLDIKKLIFIIQQNYFLENFDTIEMVKKIDGSLNFQNASNSAVVIRNREILLQNFEIDKEKKILFNAQISKFEKKGKIQFNLINTSKDIKISGFIIPSSSKVIFKKIIFAKKNFTDEKIKKYEKKFDNEVVRSSLVNIFDKIELNSFFKAF